MVYRIIEKTTKKKTEGEKGEIIWEDKVTYYVQYCYSQETGRWKYCYSSLYGKQYKETFNYDLYVKEPIELATLQEAYKLIYDHNGMVENSKFDEFSIENNLWKGEGKSIKYDEKTGKYFIED